MIKKEALLILISVLFIPIINADSIIIQPNSTGKDAYIREDDETNIFGSQEAIRIGQNWVDSANRVLIEFNLSAIPNNAIINHATVNLYLFDKITNNINNISVHRLNKSWIEGTQNYADDGATWECRYFITPGDFITCVNWQNYGGDYNTKIEDSKIVQSTLGWYSWNITNLVKQWYNNTYSNYGLLFKGIDEISDSNLLKRFYSSDFNNIELRPKLIINYSINTVPQIINFSQYPLSLYRGQSIEIRCSVKDNETENNSLNVDIKYQNNTNNGFINCNNIIYDTTNSLWKCNYITTYSNEDLGYFDFKCKVSDNILSNELINYNTVITLNNQPTFNSCLNVIIEEDSLGSTIQIDLASCSYDIENTDLVYQINNETNLTLIDCYINNKNLTCYNPLLNQNGYSQIEIQVNDTDNGIDITLIKINVTAVNDVPWWLAIPNQTVQEDSGTNSTLNLTNYGRDVETAATSLTYFIINEDISKVNCKINADGDHLDFTPAANYTNTSNLAYCNVSVSDGNSNANTTIYFNVTSVNMPQISNETPSSAGGGGGGGGVSKSNTINNQPVIESKPKPQPTTLPIIQEQQSTQEKEKTEIPVKKTNIFERVKQFTGLTVISQELTGIIKENFNILFVTLIFVTVYTILKIKKVFKKRKNVKHKRTST